MRIFVVIRNIIINIIIKVISLFKKIESLNKFFFFKNIFYLYDLEKMINDDLCWWSYSIQKELPFILNNYKIKNILEYGSGSSTVYFSKRKYNITSVEYDNDWFNKIKLILNKYKSTKIYLIKEDINIQREYVSKKNFKSYKNYAEFPLSLNEKFDLIIIDGRVREKCLEISPKLLSTNGIIIFDDTERTRYKKSINKFIYMYGYKKKDFSGSAPGNFLKNRITTLITK